MDEKWKHPIDDNYSSSSEDEWDPESYEDFSDFPAQNQSTADKTCAEPWEDMLTWDDEDNETDFDLQLQNQTVNPQLIPMNVDSTANDCQDQHCGQVEENPADNSASPQGPQPNGRLQSEETSLEKKDEEKPQKIKMKIWSNKKNVKVIESRLFVNVSSVFEPEEEVSKKDEAKNSGQEDSSVPDPKPKPKKRDKKKKKKRRQNKRQF